MQILTENHTEERNITSQTGVENKILISKKG